MRPHPLSLPALSAPTHSHARRLDCRYCKHCSTAWSTVSVGFEDQSGLRGQQIEYGDIPDDGTAYFIPSAPLRLCLPSSRFGLWALVFGLWPLVFGLVLRVWGRCVGSGVPLERGGGGRRPLDGVLQTNVF